MVDFSKHINYEIIIHTKPKVWCSYGGNYPLLLKYPVRGKIIKYDRFILSILIDENIYGFGDELNFTIITRKQKLERILK